MHFEQSASLVDVLLPRADSEQCDYHSGVWILCTSDAVRGDKVKRPWTVLDVIGFVNLDDSVKRGDGERIGQDRSLEIAAHLSRTLYCRLFAMTAGDAVCRSLQRKRNWASTTRRRVRVICSRPSVPASPRRSRWLNVQLPSLVCNSVTSPSHQSIDLAYSRLSCDLKE